MSTEYAEIKKTLDELGAEKVELDARRQPANPATISAIRAARKVLARSQFEKMTRLFPDQGPLRRELYKKHTEVFRLGADHTERLFMAANRVGKCVSFQTLIDTPSGPKRIGSMRGRQWIYAWNGRERVPALAEQPFIKERARLFRLWLDNGRHVDVAAKHRMLTQAGFVYADELLRSLPSLPSTTSGSSRIESLSDARRCLETTGDSRFGYRPGCRSYGVRPHDGRDTFLGDAPSLTDVQTHNPVWFCLDDLANKCRHSLSRVFGRLSTLGVPRQTEGLSFAFSGPTHGSGALPSNDEYPGVLQSPAAVAFRLQQTDAEVPDQAVHEQSLVSPDGLGSSIIAYQDLGEQDVWDLHVPTYHNYCSTGMVHHNSLLGAYEVTCHLTGWYPEWWEGRRFGRPVRVWACGDTSQTVRDIVQNALIGPATSPGTGMVPKKLIKGQPRKKPGMPDAVETFWVKHSTGLDSVCTFKSYEQGRKSFQGTEQDIIWADEEPDAGIYDEMLTRTMTSKGMVLITATPLSGLTPFILSFLPNGELPR